MEKISNAGKLVVVGGHSRHVGKTCVMEAILRATGPMIWNAVKVSSHRHREAGAPDALLEEHLTPDAGDQTARYLAAGAQRSFLLRAADAALPEAVAPIARMRGSGQNLLVESNRIVQHMKPDLVLFVVQPSNSDWKASSDSCLRAADAIVVSGEGELPDAAGRHLPVFRLTGGGHPPAGLGEWLRQRFADASSASPW